jgi:hypothetical protein
VGTSKNSKKGSKPTQMIMPKRVKEKKKLRLIELTSKVKSEICEDLSSYQGKQILEIKRKYGKEYLVLQGE